MTAVEEDVDDRFAGIDIDSLLNRENRKPLGLAGRKTLYEPPEFIHRLCGEETVLEGQSCVLECKVRGFPAPTLRWFKDDEEIVDHPRIHWEGDGKGGYALMLDNINKGDEAAYRCRAENVEGQCSCFFFLSVKGKRRSKKRKKDLKNSPNKRTVSFPPMFSTIVEKVEEEEKQGKEFESLPPSPMTDFYYALTLKGRQTWPSFVGDWAFTNGAHHLKSNEHRRNSTGSMDSADFDSTSDEEILHSLEDEIDSFGGHHEDDCADHDEGLSKKKTLFYIDDECQDFLDSDASPSTGGNGVLGTTLALSQSETVSGNMLHDNIDKRLFTTLHKGTSDKAIVDDNIKTCTQKSGDPSVSGARKERNDLTRIKHSNKYACNIKSHLDTENRERVGSEENNTAPFNGTGANVESTTGFQGKRSNTTSHKINLADQREKMDPVTPFHSSYSSVTQKSSTAPIKSVDIDKKQKCNSGIDLTLSGEGNSKERSNRGCPVATNVGDSTPPIIVQVWEDVNTGVPKSVPGDPTLEREEREPTPFFKDTGSTSLSQLGSPPSVTRPSGLTLAVPEIYMPKLQEPTVSTSGHEELVEDFHRAPTPIPMFASIDSSPDSPGNPEGCNLLTIPTGEFANVRAPRESTPTPFFKKVDLIGNTVNINQFLGPQNLFPDLSQSANLSPCSSLSSSPSCLSPATSPTCPELPLDNLLLSTSTSDLYDSESSEIRVMSSIGGDGKKERELHHPHYYHHLARTVKKDSDKTLDPCYSDQAPKCTVSELKPSPQIVKPLSNAKSSIPVAQKSGQAKTPTQDTGVHSYDVTNDQVNAICKNKTSSKTRNAKFHSPPRLGFNEKDTKITLQSNRNIGSRNHPSIQNPYTQVTHDQMTSKTPQRELKRVETTPKSQNTSIALQTRSKCDTLLKVVPQENELENVISATGEVNETTKQNTDRLISLDTSGAVLPIDKAAKSQLAAGAQAMLASVAPRCTQFPRERPGLGIKQGQLSPKKQKVPLLEPCTSEGQAVNLSLDSEDLERKLIKAVCIQVTKADCIPVTTQHDSLEQTTIERQAVLSDVKKDCGKEGDNVFTRSMKNISKSFGTKAEDSGTFNADGPTASEKRRTGKNLKQDAGKSTKRKKCSASKQSRRNVTMASNSPFGKYTLEGCALLLFGTLFCLYVNMGVEKFVCHVLASYYTFCVLRVLGLLE